MKDFRNANNIFIGMLEGKRPPGRPRHRLEDNIKMDLKEQVGRLWKGLMRLKIGTSSGLL
jgi:hypothetical protein